MQTLVRPDPLTPAATAAPASFSSPGLLALEGGLVLHGRLRAARVDAEGDCIFTTAASGWAEIVTDPSFAGQVVVLTHPMAGSYRLDASHAESAGVHLRALVVTRLVTPPDGPGATLEEVLAAAGIPILEGVDTRALTLQLRQGAARRGVIRARQPGANPGAADLAAVDDARRSSHWEAVDHVAAVSTAAPYQMDAVGPRRGQVVLIDYGVKRSLLRALTERGLEVHVLPHDASADEVAAHDPTLIVLSPGPGDPSRMAPQIAVVRQLTRRATAGGPPILGVCLGHQLLALAAGARTARLPVGHHGGNHAVIELDGGRVDIGAHNHEVTVLDDPALAAAGFRVTHRDLNDGTVEGLAHVGGRIASVQFHPEGAPGPTDAARIFDAALAGAGA